MPETKYDVVFTGELFDGFDKADVKANFARVFRVSDDKIEKFFSSPRVVLKANVDRKTADKYKAILAKTGAVVTVEARKPAGKPSSPAATPEERPAADRTSPAEAKADATPDMAESDSNNVGPLWGRKVAPGHAELTSQGQPTQTGDDGEYGSLEQGIAGDYTFSIGGILSEAWQKVSGNKGTALLAMLIYVGILLAFGIAASAVKGVLAAAAGDTGALLGEFISQLAQIVVTAPLGAGFFMLGVRMSVGAPASAGSILSYYDRIVPLALTTILCSLMVIIGMLLLILPGIYLAVAYFLAIPLVVDKGLRPWQAMEASRKAVTHRWFSIFGLSLILGLLYLLGALPLFIGLIWVMPMGMIAMGIVYRNIFGASSIAVE